jgi:hypothetical protein
MARLPSMTYTCQCQRCHGTGVVPLDDALHNTLAALGQKWVATAAVFEKLKGPFLTNQTAINNRLTKLKRVGLVECERRGKNLFWRKRK